MENHYARKSLSLSSFERTLAQFEKVDKHILSHSK